MKKTVLAFLLSLAYSTGFSQNLAQTEIDSMKHELAIGTEDTSRVMALNGLGNAYKFSKPDSAMYYAQEALILSRKIKYPKGEAQSLHWMGLTLHSVGSYPRAMEMELKAMRIAEKNNFSRLKVEILNRIGAIYRDAGVYEKAVEYLQQSRRLADSLHYFDRSTISQNYLEGLTF